MQPGPEAPPRDAGSPQESWLRADLAAHPGRCTLAFFHHPLVSSGVPGVNAAVAPLWQALVDHGVDVALVGHDHAYERFAQIDAGGAADPERGIRELVVGTGGKSLARRRWNAPNSEVRRSATAGILQVTLRAGEYSWRFVTAPGGRVGDSGTSDCH